MSRKKQDLDFSNVVVDYNVGLTNAEVKQRKDAGFNNYTGKGSTKRVGAIIFSNIFTFFNILIALIATALIYVGAYKDLFFLLIATLNTLIGIVQEIKAKQTIDKLSLLSAPIGLVLREEIIVEIPIKDIVINDILVLKTGKQITADAIVREGIIEVDESLLTGESNLIEKKPGDYLYSGSFIASGSCKAEVVKVGKEAYIETLTSKARKYKKPRSKLMGSLKVMIRVITIFIVPIGILLFTNSYNDPKNTLEGIIKLKDSIRPTAGAMISMIPSGLYLLTSMALAVGVLRLAQNNTLVQELYCIEMLARVDTLCLDKTGTITDGTMAVKGIIEINTNPKLSPTLILPEMMSVFVDSNQTSEAIIEKFGVADKMAEAEEIISFSSQRKYSAVTFKDNGTFILGAPEMILTKTELKRLETRINKYANDGLRVLVYAYSEGQIKNKELPSKIIPISLILIEDTIRRDAIMTIEYFKNNDVDVKVISGDNAITASHIALRAGIKDAEKYISLEDLTDSEVADAALKYQVFGRVSPEQKQILIQTLKTYGKTVAMVGDGVNDILALREADTSVAMASGSEAARNASHLVLLDSNFSSMPKVVNEGRRVINNVQKVAVLFLTKTIFSILLTILVLIFQKPYPLTTSQMIIIENLAIGIPAFFLSLEPNNSIVKGNFLNNILKTAMPGALALVTQAFFVITIFNKQMNFSLFEQNTLLVVSLSFTSMVVLYRLLKPFNIIRKLLYTALFSIGLFIVLFLPEFFETNALIPFYIRTGTVEIQRLNFNVAVILLLLLQSSVLLINFYSKIPFWIKEGFAKALKKLSSV